ncbi:MAG: alpha/beta fold hydrolase [Rhodococcus sp. (in: high G+C Gram-positive bacteria)]
MAAGYRVLALDRRGRGDSESPSYGASMKRHGQDLANFLVAVEITDAVLIGGSMGASTVWCRMSRNSGPRTSARSCRWIRRRRW